MCTNVESCYRKKCVQCPYGCMLQSMFGFNYVRQIIWKYTSSTCIWYETMCSQPLALCYQTCSKRHERLGIPGRVKHRGSHRWSLHRWPRLFTLLPEELPWRFMWSVWGQGKVVCWLKNGFPPSLEMGEINFEIYSWIFWPFFFSDLCVCTLFLNPHPLFSYLAAGSTGMSMLTYTEGGWMLRRHMQDDRDTISDQNPDWLFYIGDYTTQLYVYKDTHRNSNKPL